MTASERQEPGVGRTATARCRRLLVGAALLWAATPAQAAYITPEQAGFHHCVLIYDAQARSAEGFLPFVAHLNPVGDPDQWLFDSFLFIPAHQGPNTQASYHTGSTNLADWQALLDGWFDPEHGLAALGAARSRAQGRLGGPVRPLRVILTVPYPSEEQAGFGDVTGDGLNDSLAETDGRAAAVEWLLDETLRRWTAARLDGLELWGFYWVNEAVGAGDAPIVQRAARLVHDRGYRFLWIPWFRAPGFRVWRELGFDVAILQPNYAFLSDHLGRVRSDRLTETAALAESLGMGVEMEVGYAPERDLREREIFREYLAFGAPAACGYQPAATAYYQSLETFVHLQQAPDPDARRVYDEIAAYVRGEAVQRPGTLAGGQTTRLGAFRVSLSVPEVAVGNQPGPPVDPDPHTVRVGLPERRPIGEIELSVLRAETAWTALVSLDLRSPTGEWRPAGWVRAVVPARDDDARTHCVVPVPVFAEGVEGLRLSVTPADPSSALTIEAITATCGPPRLDWPVGSLATGRPYTVEPDFSRRYPDRGGMLTDGEASTEGWPQGRSVGWYGQDVVVQLDLGSVVPVERIVVHADGGGHAAVEFPLTVAAELAVTEPPAGAGASGPGPCPPAPAASLVVARADLQMDGQRDLGDAGTTAWGRYELRPATPTPARFVALSFPPGAWLMLSEVEVWSQGRNVAPAGRYLVSPYPSPTEDAKYADDGRVLTDGYISTGFAPRRLAGWPGGQAVTVTADLGGEREVREVTVHTLGGGLCGIVAPPGGTLELSPDGVDYHAAASAALADPADNTASHLPLTFALPAPDRARFIRVRLSPSSGWLMVSEVAVR